MLVTSLPSFSTLKNYIATLDRLVPADEWYPLRGMGLYKPGRCEGA